MYPGSDLCGPCSPTNTCGPWAALPGGGLLGAFLPIKLGLDGDPPRFSLWAWRGGGGRNRGRRAEVAGSERQEMHRLSPALCFLSS